MRAYAIFNYSDEIILQTVRSNRSDAWKTYESMTGLSRRDLKKAKHRTVAVSIETTSRVMKN